MNLRIQDERTGNEPYFLYAKEPHGNWNMVMRFRTRKGADRALRALRAILDFEGRYAVDYSESL